jgi:leucyl aminopeptidase
MVKKLINILFVYLFLSNTVFCQNNNISHLTNQINTDSLQKNVEELQAFHSRYLFSSYNKQIAEYLKDRLENYGFTVKIDSFLLQNVLFPYDSTMISNTGWQYNVISLKEGTDENDSSLFLTAHYDCISNRLGYSDYMHFAPGADDNASGVSAILEIARILSNNPINQKHNLRIEFYAAEEIGMAGSDRRMYELSNPWNMYVLGDINLDMIGYSDNSDSANKVCINYYDNSSWLTELTMRNTLLYSSLQTNLTKEYSARSDSYSFYSWNLPAIFLSENVFSPYYHTPQDSSTYLNYNYIKQISSIALSVCYDIVTKPYYTVGLDDIAKQDITLNILSNNNDELVFSTSNAEKINRGRIIICNSLGQQLINKPLKSCRYSQNTYKLDIKDLTSSIYVLVVEDNKSIVSKKFAKIKN